MELRHLRYFVVVAEELHFARAAARLGIEQSPLSRQIQDLEADLRVRLFERTRRATSLTRVGERFLADARRILDDVDGSIRATRAFSNGGQPIRLGLAEWIGGSALHRLMRLCRDIEPSIDLILTESTSAKLFGFLSTGALDAILAPTQFPTADFESAPVWNEDLVVAAPCDLATSGKSSWWRDFSGRPWILPNPRALPGYSRQTEILLSQRGLKLRSDLTFVCPKVLAGLVATGAGVALLPKSLVPDVEDVSFHQVKDASAVATTWLTVRRGGPSSRMEAFESMIRTAATARRNQDAE